MKRLSPDHKDWQIGKITIWLVSSPYCRHTITVPTRWGVGTSVVTSVYIRTALIKAPEEARYNNVMTRHVYDYRRKNCAIFFSSVALSYESLVTVTRTNAVPTIAGAFLVALARRS